MISEYLCMNCRTHLTICWLWCTLQQQKYRQVRTNHTHTHTRLMALCLGLPGWVGTRKVKPVWISLKQETVSGSGISWAVYKSAPRSRQITTPAPHHSVFYRPDALPATQPTASKHWRYILAMILLLWYCHTAVFSHTLSLYGGQPDWYLACKTCFSCPQRFLLGGHIPIWSNFDKRPETLKHCMCVCSFRLFALHWAIFLVECVAFRNSALYSTAGRVKDCDWVSVVLIGQNSS